MTTEEVDEIRREFELMDADKTGTIEPSELAEILRILDPSWDDESIKGLFACLDKDSNGHIDYNEFVDYIFDAGESQFFTSADDAKLKKAGRTAPSDVGRTAAASGVAPASLQSLLNCVNDWSFTTGGYLGDYGDEDFDSDWSTDATQLTITRDLHFELVNSQFGNSAESYGGRGRGGYKYKSSETYRGQCSIVKEVSSGKHQLRLEPSSVKLYNRQVPHRHHKPRTHQEEKEFKSGVFMVLLSANEAVIQDFPRGVWLWGHTLNA
mmetsp:Transcript_145856/g.257291  ORF Transcript_145856/g.257291 Transcript_145856/m.257291 type:complete len:266 (+) Transcript_145856:93-890(+)